MPKKRKRKLPRQSRPKHEPTLEEIAAKCEDIQAGWTPTEELQRRGKAIGHGERRYWTPPTANPGTPDGRLP